MESRIDPSHSGARSLLRILGPILLITGVLLLIIGGIRMFSPAWSHDPFDSFEQSARTSFSGFGMVAAGMLCLFCGSVMTIYGFMGRVTRYSAAEIAPVASDTFNCLAQGSKQGIATVAKSIASGIAQGMKEPPVSDTQCPQCGAVSESDASFCSQCGHSLETTCPSCNGNNKASSRFCHNCGKPLKVN